MALQGVLTLALGLVAAAQAGDLLVDTLLNFDERQVSLLKRSGPLLEVEPVALPEGDNLLGKNSHFGWPVATRAGDAIIVVFHRQTGHGTRQENPPDQDTSRAVVTRSVDGGQTWSRPVDLRQFIKQPTEGCRLGFGNAITTAHDGAVVVVTEYGVFRSTDRGASWEHLPGAFGAKQLSGPSTNLGPVLIEHPDYGLTAFGHRRKAGTGGDTSGVADELWVRYSKDGGRTWQETMQELPAFVKPVEPTALVVNGSLVVLARGAAQESYEPATRTWRYVQLWSRSGWLPLEAKLTSIRTSDVRHLPPYRASHGPFSQDTVDIALNPATGRLEAVVTNRDGGGAGREQIHTHMTLNLWSIDPARLLAGDAEWRFEGTLLARPGIKGTRDVDGMHPGAAVIDAQRGVQHVFIYLGYNQGPAGIFRVTRTLDTPKLSGFLREQQNGASQAARPAPTAVGEPRERKLLAGDTTLADPSSLRLLPSRTSPVYLAEKGGWQFNLHSYLAWHGGKFWAIWSSGRVDEDSGNQVIRYSTSTDGHHWTPSQVLVDDPDGPARPGLWIARGIFVLDGKLVALAAYNEGPSGAGETRDSWHNLRLARFEWTGKAWADRGVFVDNCMNNYPPRPLGGGLFMTCRDSFARMHTARSDSPAGGKWEVTPMPDPAGARLSEPSWYVDPEGVAHLIFRDSARSKYLYQATSRDRGRTWTAPVRTNYPDAGSKNIAGRLGNGAYFLINNPNQAGRDPLAISFSQDGWMFSSPQALRKDAPAQRYPGRAKGNRSFQYPHVLERGGSFWVIYSTNKEDIEISEFKLADFPVSTAGKK